ncbi:MAG: hypothetical protein II007_15255 [Gammaproteobacteria bacterium]|nr:hypothetical protein [Gammaproteobacteria bacterium]
MNTIVIVSLVARDQPGLIQELALACQERHALWLDTRVAHLDGQLAALIRISAPEERMEEIKQLFGARSDLTASFNAPSCEVAAERHSLKLRVDATDRPGIVNDITRLLDDQGVVLSNMASRCVAVTGIEGTLFTAELDLMLPANIAAGDLTAELEALGGNLVVRSALAVA